MPGLVYHVNTNTQKRRKVEKENGKHRKQEALI